MADPIPPATVPPSPLIPPIPSVAASSTTTPRLPRLLKATYITSGEKLLWETRPTRWFFLPAPVFFLVLVALIDAVLWNSIQANPVSFLPVLHSLSGVSHALIEIVMVVLILIGVVFFGVRWLHYAMTVYVITSTRVIRQKGILAKDFDEVQLLQVRGVDVKQHVFQRILGYGTVRISAEFGGTAQAMGNEDWAGVPRSIEFERTIEEAQERLRGILPAPTPAKPVSR